MKKLKPCPFCGASGDDIEFNMIYPNAFTKPMMYVMCQKCGGAIFDTDGEHCPNDVYRAWNRRPAPDPDKVWEDIKSGKGIAREIEG